MMTRRKVKSQRNFNEEAEIYDVEYEIWLNDTKSVLNEAKTEPLGYVLDVGCGTGTMLSKLSGESVKVGLDISPKMIAKAKEKLGTNCYLCAGDSETLPFRDESFDVILSSLSFHHYENPEAVVAEIRRVIRKGGRLLICDVYDTFPWRFFWNVRFRFGSNPKGDVHIYSEKEITYLLKQGGFDHVLWKRVGEHTFLISAKPLK